MGMKTTFNLNLKVTVRLTNRGLDILEMLHQQDQKLSCRMRGDSFEPTEFEVPPNRMYTTQLHDLIDTFGKYVGMGRELPFETTIELHGVVIDLAEQPK